MLPVLAAHDLDGGVAFGVGGGLQRGAADDGSIVCELQSLGGGGLPQRQDDGVVDLAGDGVGAGRGSDAVNQVVDPAVALCQFLNDLGLGGVGERVGIEEGPPVGEFSGAGSTVPTGGGGAAVRFGSLVSDADADRSAAGRSKCRGQAVAALKPTTTTTGGFSAAASCCGSCCQSLSTVATAP